MISKDITWATFVRPDFNEGLDEVLRPKMDDKDNEEPNVNIELSDKDEIGSET